MDAAGGSLGRIPWPPPPSVDRMKHSRIGIGAACTAEGCPNSRAHWGHTTSIRKVAWAQRSSPSSSAWLWSGGLHGASHVGRDLATGEVAPPAELAGGAGGVGGVVPDQRRDKHDETHACAWAGDGLHELPRTMPCHKPQQRGEAQRESSSPSRGRRSVPCCDMDLLKLVLTRSGEVKAQPRAEEDALDGYRKSRKTKLVAASLIVHPPARYLGNPRLASVAHGRALPRSPLRPGRQAPQLHARGPAVMPGGRGALARSLGVVIAGAPERGGRRDSGHGMGSPEPSQPAPWVRLPGGTRSKRRRRRVLPVPMVARLIGNSCSNGSQGSGATHALGSHASGCRAGGDRRPFFSQFTIVEPGAPGWARAAEQLEPRAHGGRRSLEGA
jgi:hypothetical protein